MLYECEKVWTSVSRSPVLLAFRRRAWHAWWKLGTVMEGSRGKCRRDSSRGSRGSSSSGSPMGAGTVEVASSRVEMRPVVLATLRADTKKAWLRREGTVRVISVTYIFYCENKNYDNRRMKRSTTERFDRWLRFDERNRMVILVFRSAHDRIGLKRRRDGEFE